MTREFDELVGGDVAPDERESLRRAHELLIAAGPAPELPAALAEAPVPELARVRPLPPPRRARVRLSRIALPLAAALAAVAFAGGYVAGRDGEDSFATDFVLTMHGTAAAPGATATLRVGELDEAGNWPMEMTVEGLPPGALYELSLTRDGRPAVSCGFFVVAEEPSTAYLNAPYKLREFDGWVVTRARSREILLADET